MHLWDTSYSTALLLAVYFAGRRGRDRDALALSIAAILAPSPLLEMHYLAALLVVVALYQRRFGPVWAVPLLICGRGLQPLSAKPIVTATTPRTCTI